MLTQSSGSCWLWITFHFANVAGFALLEILLLSFQAWAALVASFGVGCDFIITAVVQRFAVEQPKVGPGIRLVIAMYWMFGNMLKFPISALSVTEQVDDGTNLFDLRRDMIWKKS